MVRGNVKEFSFNKLKIIDLQLFHYVLTLYVEIFSSTVFSKVVIKKFIFQRSIHFISHPIFNFYVFVSCFCILLFFNKLLCVMNSALIWNFPFYSYLILAHEIKNLPQILVHLISWWFTMETNLKDIKNPGFTYLR